MQKLESDDPVGAQNIHVTFYQEARPNNFRAQQTGKPEFDTVDFIRKVAGGNPNNVIERPASEQDKREFPRHWAAYQNQTMRMANGTPVEEWSRIDRGTVARLKALEFHTVDQLAEASDTQIATIGLGCNELRTKARAFIAAAKDTALVQKQAEQLADRDQEISDLRDALARTNAQVEELTRAMAEANKPKARATTAKEAA